MIRLYTDSIQEKNNVLFTYLYFTGNFLSHVANFTLYSILFRNCTVVSDISIVVYSVLDVIIISETPGAISSSCIILKQAVRPAPDIPYYAYSGIHVSGNKVNYYGWWRRRVIKDSLQRTIIYGWWCRRVIKDSLQRTIILVSKWKGSVKHEIKYPAIYLPDVALLPKV